MKDKEYKKEMTKDKAAKIITKGINSRAKLNTADKYLKEKKQIEEFVGKMKRYSRNELEIIAKNLQVIKAMLIILIEQIILAVLLII